MPEYQSCYTVSNLNSQIRNLLEGSLSDIWVKGEISNFHHHPSSGHMYFTLKDENGELRCAMFRGNNQYLKFKPGNGMEVRLFGSVTIYEQRGQVQLKVSLMEPAGLGDLFKAFDALKKALSEEGLFDPVHKQPLPKYPKKIGVVTSGSSAAFQDIIHVLKRRSPHVEIILKSVSVQGESSALDIADGINEMNQFGQVDVIILGRGGGSLEDLWSFNEEAVARSIFKSDIPIISAVGHETDFTISDFVADLRAPTPSAAAELASIPTEDIYVSLGEFKVDLASVLEKIIERSWVRMDHLETRTSLQQPQKIIEAQSDTVSNYYQRIIQVMQTSQKNFVNKTTVLEKQLIGLGPSQVLNRGYSIAYMDSGEIIRSSVDIEIGDPFTLSTGKGSLGAEKTSDL